MIANDLSKLIGEAMKQRDKVRRTTLQLLKSELHNEEIAKQHQLTEDEELVVVRREAKKRKDAIEAFAKAGNNERAESEKQELLVLQEFLPKELSEVEIEKVVLEVMSEIDSSASNMGRIIGEVVKRTEGRADGGIVSKIVRSRISIS